MSPKNIFFKIIKFTKNLFIIKRVIAIAVLLFCLWEFGSDALYSVQNKEHSAINSEKLLALKELPKYIKLTNYNLDFEHPFQVNKLFKKEKTPLHFYLPLVSPSNPKKIIALITDYSTNDIDAYQVKSYRNTLHKKGNYFKNGVKSKLLHGEKEFYESRGFMFANNFVQLDVGSPPTSTKGYLIGFTISLLLFSLMLLSFIPTKFLSRWFDQYTGIDYSFEVKPIKKILKQIEHKKYSKAFENIKQLSVDEKTQAIDALALMLSEKKFIEWSKNDANSNLLKLVKGSRLIYDAWEARGYQYAEDTNHENALGFHELLEKAIPILNQVQGELKVDANDLLIRAYKGLGDIEAAKRSFEYCISAEPLHTMAHIKYLDVILPKWHGSKEEVELFIKDNMHKSPFLEYILEAIKAHEYMREDEDNKYTADYITNYEPSIKKLKTKTPHRFILYNYLYFFGNELKNRKVTNRYERKLNDFLSPTLYSPLRSEKEIKDKLE